MNKCIKILTYLIVLFGVVNWVMSSSFIHEDLSRNVWNWFSVLAAAFLCLNIAYYLFMLITAYCFYRSGKGVPDEQLPTCTVIIPAYNEGRDVAKTIESVIASNYPPEKLQIITIDDGSKDDTWLWIQSCVEKYGSRVLALKHEKNSGKRKALHTGIKASHSEVVISVDSDCIVEPDALRKIAAHFLDPQIGGVAGNLRVLNLDVNILPRMLDVCFVFNFDIMRASQSIFGCVFCTPGALSGYRRSALVEFIDNWVDETFCGAKAEIGEDRALSTELLRRNYRVIFEREACAATKVPTNYATLCRMFLRWCRGDIRETMKMYTFILNRINAQRLVLLFNIVMQTIWIISPIFLVPGIIFVAMMHSEVFFYSLYFSIILWATLPALVYARKNGMSNAIWAYCYALFYIGFLFWVVPYSICSINNSRWMTRRASNEQIYEQPGGNHPKTSFLP